jgi:hypothetical protein
MSIFKDFMNGVLNKQELIDKIDQVDDTNIEDCNLFASIKMAELVTGKIKTVRVCSVD